MTRLIIAVSLATAFGGAAIACPMHTEHTADARPMTEPAKVDPVTTAAIPASVAVKPLVDEAVEEDAAQ